MQIDSIRIYAEVLEQGLDFKKYIQKVGYTCDIQNIYTKKKRGCFSDSDSLIDRIRKAKDVDVLVTAIADKKEYPILMVEYSTAVPTDDHKWQRFDVLFWGSRFQVPIMKISPLNKGMEQDFGGGSKITNELEIYLSNKIKAIYYPIVWENDKSSECLDINTETLSCIAYRDEIFEILKENLNLFSKTEDYSKYYKMLLVAYQDKYSEILGKYKDVDLKTVITNSSRFKWLDDKLCAKINRFGHAMDPDRGVLYFVNMLLGAKNTIAEIQVNRKKEYNSRGGYKSLFDGISQEAKLKEYVENIIKNQNNVFTTQNALFVFLNALNISEHLQFEKISEKNFFIKDDVLENFLLKYPSMTVKSIFYLATELRLTDIDRNIICKITWNEKIINNYLSFINCDNYKQTSIKPLNKNQAKEDIITYSCTEIYKKLKHNLLAVSYPGAQGDRCILCGCGRNALRTYVDIITYKKDENNIKVFLHECKEKFEHTSADVIKLRNICKNKDLTEGLFALCQKVAKIQLDEKTEFYSAVGAKYNNSIIDNIDVDYIFLFDILNNEKNTIIDYSIALINLGLAEEFKSLVDFEGKLKGKLIFDLIYSIDE